MLFEESLYITVDDNCSLAFSLIYSTGDVTKLNMINIRRKYIRWTLIHIL